MRYAFLTLLALIGINLSAQTNVQYQAHVPFRAESVSFSAYIADDSFNENSHLNSDAFWYVENQVVEVHNGIINVLLEDIADSVFLQNEGNIYVFAYVNGQPLGRLPFHQLPYALHANVSDVSARAILAEESRFAGDASHADTADYSVESGHSVYSDTATHALNADVATRSEVSLYAASAGHSVNSDTAQYAHNAGLSEATDFVNENGVNTFSIQNGSVVSEKIADASITSSKLGVGSVQHQHIADGAVDFNNIDGGSGAAIGTYLTRGASGLVWATNPQHRTTSVSIYTSAPTELTGDSRWVVSRVAVDYNLATITLPLTGQLVTIYNGATANTVTLDSVTWNIDTGLDCVIYPSQSRTLWWNGFNWVVIG